MVNTAIPDPAPVAVPEPAPLSIGGVAAEAASVLWDAERWELPRPCYLTVHDIGAIGFLFADTQASFAALARWLEAFGGTITNKDIRHDDGRPARLCQVNFTYHDTPMEAYAIVTTATVTV